MIGLILLSIQASAAPTYAAVSRLPPAVAGDRLLSGRQHGRIMSVEAPTGGMTPTGTVEAQLVEQPSAQGPRCVRTRWTVKFFASPDQDIGSAAPDTIYSTTDIALVHTSACPTKGYVHLKPGLDQEQGFAALAVLQRARSSAPGVRLTCSDQTSSGLCADDRTTRRALAAIAPWAISRDAGDLLIWLGTGGRIVTELRFDPAAPDRIAVERRFPAPF